ncbi:DUF6053 domain-containing protein [Lysobacter enzymogenes]|uniref:DUF6053 domain-containing protein n=1 Tax=Lysobacter enzymogenes TaxID=69 RepID=UPI003748E04A
MPAGWAEPSGSPGPRRIGDKSVGPEGPPTTAALPVGRPSGPMPSAQLATSHRKRKPRG